MSTCCQLFSRNYLAASKPSSRAEDKLQCSDHSDDEMTEIDVCLLIAILYLLLEACELEQIALIAFKERVCLKYALLVFWALGLLRLHN